MEVTRVSVPLAYVGVILIWSTTPLTIQWSGDGVGFLFGVASRMTLGACVALLVLALWHRSIPLHRKALQTYLVGGLGIFVAMTTVYWSAQFIPSGWIAVIFGLSPIVTGVMAGFWLDEQAFTPARVAGIALGLVGLLVIFATDSGHYPHAALGIGGVLLSTLAHSASGVWVKRIDAGIQGLAVTTGSLWVALPMYIVVWVASGGITPEVMPVRTLVSIVYLAVIGSVLGFSLYFYILKHLAASRVSLITLVTPVGALLIGAWLNAEPVDGQIVTGTVLILTGLFFYEFGPYWSRQQLRA